MRDNHLHTHFSYDSEAQFEDYLTHYDGDIVTTEHYDLSNPYTKQDDVPDYDAYSREIAELNRKYGNRIKKGIFICDNAVDTIYPSLFSYTSVTSYPNASIIARKVLFTTFSFFLISRFTYDGVMLISFASSACVVSFSIHLTFTSTSILFLSMFITCLSITNNCMIRTIYCCIKSVVCIDSKLKRGLPSLTSPSLTIFTSN